jgi:hypothetical protein
VAGNISQRVSLHSADPSRLSHPKEEKNQTEIRRQYSLLKDTEHRLSRLYGVLLYEYEHIQPGNQQLQNSSDGASQLADAKQFEVQTRNMRHAQRRRWSIAFQLLAVIPEPHSEGLVYNTKEQRTNRSASLKVFGFHLP